MKTISSRQPGDMHRFWMATTVAALLCLTAPPDARASMDPQPTTTISTITSQTPTKHWELMNGDVDLPSPLRLNVGTASDATKDLSNPQLIGAGGGGAVFVFDDNRALLKVSWEGSRRRVESECNTLRFLQDHHVQGTEQCLAIYDYPLEKQQNGLIATSTSTEPSKNKKERQATAKKPNESSSSASRVAILVEPYVQDAVASIDEISSVSAQQVAVQQIGRTLVQMLIAHVITIDVQPLINQDTGAVLFIDMTEAQILSSFQSNQQPLSFLEQTLISSFCSEMVALVPERHWTVFQKAVRVEFQQQQQALEEGSRPFEEGETKPKSALLSAEVMDILESQVGETSSPSKGR